MILLSTNGKPTAAFVLSLLGGIVVILVSFIVMILGAVLTFFAKGIGGLFGFFGMICGTFMIIGAIMLWYSPRNHVVWSLVILIASILSWFGSFGGLFIGFILGLTGGILGILYLPNRFKTQIIRICPHCGRRINFASKFCQYCGRELP